MYINFILKKCLFSSGNYIDCIFAVNMFYFYFGLYNTPNVGDVRAEDYMFINPIKFIINNFILFNVISHYKIIYNCIKS